VPRKPAQISSQSLAHETGLIIDNIYINGNYIGLLIATYNLYVVIDNNSRQPIKIDIDS
jgi:hypothetical protein